MSNPPSASHPAYRLRSLESSRSRNETWLEYQTEPRKKPTRWTAALPTKGVSKKKGDGGLFQRLEAKLNKRPNRSQPKGKPVRQKGGYSLSAREMRWNTEQQQIAAIKRSKKKPPQP